MKNGAGPILTMPPAASFVDTFQRSGSAFDRQSLLTAALVFVGYYTGATIGFHLTFKPYPVSVLWPPNSILLAALLLTRVQMWWVVLAVALPAHWLVQLQSGVPGSMVLCWFVSNSFEAVIGATFVRQFVRGPLRFDRLHNVAVFCLGAAFLGPFLSSFLDCGFVALNHWGQGSYWEIWRIRFASNVLAVFMITPFIVTWAIEGIGFWRILSRRRLIEAGSLLLGLCLISAILFNKKSFAFAPALLYAPLPFLLWAAVRFGSRGATLAILALSFSAVWGVVHGHGPFSHGSAEENALYVQLFLIFMAVPLLFLGALIEERNEAETTLRERDERIGLAAETANLVLWTIDFARRESWMNDKGRSLFGFGPNERLSRETFLARVHPEDRRLVDEAIERARAGSQSFEIEYRVLRPDNETSWLIARGRYLRTEQGEISGLIGVAIDVTPQVEANLQLRLQREEMARLSRVASMGELTASLAHELNQPLTAIASNAAAARRFLTRGQTDPKMLEEFLADVVSDAQRAGDIIHGIHRFVRKGTGIRSAVDLNNVIREVLRLLHSDLLGRSVTVDTDLMSNLGSVRADPTPLQQVLLNLIMNALEAMHDTPMPRRRIVICSTARDGFVQVSVRDHGAGLPAGNSERVFSHFFSTKPNGMGMGLTIVRSIVEEHGGKIAVEKAEGGGTRFYFTLPTSKEVANDDNN